MSQIFQYPYRIRLLFLLGILAPCFTFARSPLAAAAECPYLVLDNCIEPFDGELHMQVIERYFVIEYDQDCTRIYDVFVIASRPGYFRNVMDPARGHSPNLRQYNASLHIKALGEIKAADLDAAVASGDVSVLSRLLLDERCGFGEFDDPFDGKFPIFCEPFPPPPPEPPWAMTAVETLDQVFYAHTHVLEPDCTPFDDPALGILPEGTLSTFLLVREDQIPELMSQIGFEQ